MNRFKNLLLLTVLFISISCSQRQTKTISYQKTIAFSYYLKTLDTIPLPFDHACTRGQFPQMSVHYDSAGFVKYKDADCAKPLGILFNDSTNIVTVDLSIGDYCVVPFLVSFDQKGHKIDSLNMYENSYQDTASASMPYFKITRDKRIVIIDTVKEWKNSQNVNTKSDSVFITVYSTEYHLSKNGKFIKGTRKKF